MSENQQDEQEQIKQRRAKLALLRDNGIAFPTDFRRNEVSSELLAAHNEKTKEELEEQAVRVKVAGRIMTRRIMGKASFCHIQDMSGKIQLYVTRDTLPEGFYNEQFKKWDIGDIVGAEGQLFKTKVGELSIRVDAIRLLTKA
ncbi:MAG: OB-fold nucleic acid binding domain-containing protein, partial [Methylococcales bacterium]